MPATARALSGPKLLPLFSSLIPEMIVPYADAASVMLRNLDRGNAMSRRRVGLVVRDALFDPLAATNVVARIALAGACHALVGGGAVWAAVPEAAVAASRADAHNRPDPRLP